MKLWMQTLLHDWRKILANKEEPFGKYEEPKVRIKIDIEIASKEKERKKMIEDLEAKLRT